MGNHIHVDWMSLYMDNDLIYENRIYYNIEVLIMMLQYQLWQQWNLHIHCDIDGLSNHITIVVFPKLFSHNHHYNNSIVTWV